MTMIEWSSPHGRQRYVVDRRATTHDAVFDRTRGRRRRRGRDDARPQIAASRWRGRWRLTTTTMGERAREGGEDVMRNIYVPSLAVVALVRRRSRRRRRTRCTGTTTASPSDDDDDGG
mmetsp:Transcript_3366/g.11312  ORF Transcript_3366/g.11312 Transcript_3366/m.11312 type:complete len:118 (+) Transcript_3366:54-407(+)